MGGKVEIYTIQSNNLPDFIEEFDTIPQKYQAFLFADNDCQ